MVCYWSISARLPYTFLLPFVLRLAAFVHADNVGWCTRGLGLGGNAGWGYGGGRWSPTQEFRVPRVPRVDSRDSGGERKTTLFPLCLFFLFFPIENLAESFGERKREESRCEIFRGHRARRGDKCLSFLRLHFISFILRTHYVIISNISSCFFKDCLNCFLFICSLHLTKCIFRKRWISGVKITSSLKIIIKIRDGMALFFCMFDIASILFSYFWERVNESLASSDAEDKKIVDFIKYCSTSLTLVFNWTAKKTSSRKLNKSVSENLKS